MLQEIEKLLILQDRDRKIRTLKQQIKRAPLERAELEAKQGSAHASLEATKLKAREVEVAKKKLEMDAQSKRDSIGKFKAQQFQTRKNDEFQALSNEIKRFEREIRDIEDKELDLMGEVEKMKGAVVVAEKEALQIKNIVIEQLASLEVKLKSIQTELQRIESDRGGLTVGIDEEVLNKYDRLFLSKGDVAIVPLEHEVCMGCHMKLTTQTAVRVKGNQQIVHCEQCGRILYHQEG